MVCFVKLRALRCCKVEFLPFFRPEFISNSFFYCLHFLKARIFIWTLCILHVSVRDSRGGGASARGGFSRGERGRGRGGRGYGQNRDFSGDNANDFQGGYGGGGYGGGGYGDGAVTGGAEGERERGPRPPYRGGGRRGGYRNGEFGDDSERPPRRNYERHSGTVRGYEMKRDGAGRGNWGTATDEVLAQ